MIHVWKGKSRHYPDLILCTLSGVHMRKQLNVYLICLYSHWVYCSLQQGGIVQVQFYPAIMLEFTFRVLYVPAQTLNSFTDGNVPLLDNRFHHLYAGSIVVFFTFFLSYFLELSFYHVALVLCAAFQMGKKEKIYIEEILKLLSLMKARGRPNPT